MAILGPPRYILPMGEPSAPVPDSDGAADASRRRRRAHRLVAGLVIAVAVGLNFGAVSRGLQADDNVYTTLIRNHLAGRGTGPWYEIASLSNPDGPVGIQRWIDQGFLPWWSDPGLKWALFRPVALATHFLDMSLWPDSPHAMHVHNLVWYAVLLLSVGWLYGRLAAPPVGAAGAAGTAGASRSSRLPGLAALAALSFFAFNVTNVAVASWIATRNAMMSALFAVLCVALHDVARRRPGRRQLLWLLASSGMLLLSLLCSEGGIAAWAYLIAYALWADEGSVAARVRALSPALASTVLWIMGYRALGFGTAAGGVYIDPVTDPLAFVQVLPERMGWLLRELFGLPAGLAPQHALLPAVSDWLTIATVALLCVWSLLDRRMRFWMGGCIASLVPWCAGHPTYRMLLIPAVGAFGALGYAVACVVAERPRLVAALPGSARAPAVGALIGLSVVWTVLHVPVGAALAPKMIDERQHVERVLDDLAASMPADGPGRTMMLLNTPSYVFTLFASFYRADDPFQTGRAYTLGASDRPVRIIRPAKNSLRLRPKDGYLLEFTSLLPRAASHRFASGQRVSMGRARVTVEQVTPDGRPRSVRFDFDDLDDPGLLWTAVQWDGPALVAVPITLPPVGGSLLLPAVQLRH